MNLVESIPTFSYSPKKKSLSLSLSFFFVAYHYPILLFTLNLLYIHYSLIIQDEACALYVHEENICIPHLHLINKQNFNALFAHTHTHTHTHFKKLDHHPFYTFTLI